MVRNNSPTNAGPRINKEIFIDPVRLIDNNGKMIGVVKLQKALDMAEDIGLDLVEVSPNAKPPVCKILDHGKFKFEAQKKAAKAKKKQKVIDIKELKFRPNIDLNDFNIKIKSIKKFLAAGDKVKISLRYRGREMAHRELGIQVLERVKEETKDISKVELEPKLEGRQAVMILTPEEKK
ncbi:translation initiation factor IF-3 [Alphaproteobacteria bacterium]|nr:translation initiation factor IF-3 [Alphaproteobacteria bacterium]